MRAFIRRGGLGGAYPQIVFYETVPGGAGYLEELANNLPKVSEAADERLFGHDCRKACYLCLKRYENQRWHSQFDKELVRDTLFHLSLEPPQIAKEGKVGESISALEDIPSVREQEAADLREQGQTRRGPQSPIESALLEALQKIPELPQPTPQFEIREDDVLITVPDFAYDDRKIAVYCDGYQYHASAETLELDARKRNYLQQRGWAVLTFWGRTIVRNPEACAKQLARVYQARAHSA